MVVTISNLTDTVTLTANVIKCYKETVGFGDTNKECIVVKNDAGFDEQILDALEDVQCTDCRVAFGDARDAESAVYLDCAEFVVNAEGNKIVITGEDLRWA